MARRKSMTRNKNHSSMGIKSCDNVVAAPWSDLNHDVLLLVMMQLALVDFIAFSKVCKLWRSLAILNTDMFMYSIKHMSICISSADEKECHLMDFSGRMFKTILPHSRGITCVGSTCGYLILFGKETNDFWLVNPITRHQLHFPYVTFDVYHSLQSFIAVIVFSPSISEWVFLMSHKHSLSIWFSIAGKREWTRLFTPFFIHDLHAFKGRIYALHSATRSFGDSGTLCEMTLYPNPLKILQTKNFRKPEFRFPFKVHKLDFDDMKWVSSKKTEEEYAFFFSELMWVYSGIQYWRCRCVDT